MTVRAVAGCGRVPDDRRNRRYLVHHCDAARRRNWYGYNFTVHGAHVADPANRDIWTGTPGSFSSIGAWSMVMVPGAASKYMVETKSDADLVRAVEGPRAQASRRLV